MQSPHIIFHPSPMAVKPVFSIIIPTWNNLPYLQQCLESIRKNSAYNHEVILHINEGKDGTLEWAKTRDISFSHSEENAGICFAVNAAFSLCTADYIMYMNDDMYVCPGWDEALYENIQSLGHHYFFLSATMIERVPGNPAVIAPFDYGDLESGFAEEKLLSEFHTYHKNDWNGASWPPNVVHRSLWEKAGGFSTEFSPGMYSDPDFSMKLWQAGVRTFLGVGKSRVYHFGAKSTGRVQKNNGRVQFYQKWKLPPSYFYEHVLKMGTDYRGALPEMKKDWAYYWARMKAWLK